MTFNDLGSFDDGIERKRKYKKNNYPKCYIDKRHDGDPICKECALDLYGSLPKKKFNYPRNCWNCEESGVDIDFVDKADESEPFFEED